MKQVYRLIVICIGFIHSPSATAQRYLKNVIPYQNHISLTTSNDTHIRAEITSQPSPDTYISNKIWYYWYYKDTIIQAQSTYHGKLLHGDYREFFSNWKPKVMGKFYYGKKVGEWKFWDDSGIIRKTSHWNNGQKTGLFRLYNEKGILIQKGKMRDGKLHGIIKAYSQEDSIGISRQKFKNDKLIKKEKKNQISNLFNKLTTLF